jgi:hypothetical protein
MADPNQPPIAVAQTGAAQGVSAPTAGSAPTMASSPTLDPRIEEAFAKFQADIARLQALLAATEADRNTLQDRLNQSTALLAKIEAAQTDISTTATQATAAKTQISDAQSVIATKSTHIQDAQTHADKVRADLDRALTAAQAKLTEITGNNDRAKAAADAATALQAALATVKAAGEADAGQVKSAATAAATDAAATKKLADKAATVETRIAAYEARLAEFEQKATKQLQDIVDLLPGATSAGLAHAFDQRRNTFLEPSKRWQWIFVGSIALLVILAISGLLQASLHTEPQGWDQLFRLWLVRAPIAVALVWLALYASREAGLAKRLEEDYGYKSAIASSFQGFQQQMKEVGAAAAPNSPLGKLCTDTLLTLASPPGRIYEKHSLTVTPASEITAIVKATLEATTGKKSEPSA